MDVVGTEKPLTVFPESKYNKCFKEVLIGVHPAESVQRMLRIGGATLSEHIRAVCSG